MTDQDPNGGGAVVLPDQPGSLPHLLIWGAKRGQIYVADRDNMGMLMNGDSGLVQAIAEWDPNGCAGDDSSCVRTLPAYWNGNVYFIVQNHGLQVFNLNNGVLSTTPIAQDTTAAYPLRGRRLQFSSNGATNGIVWAAKVDPDPNPGGGNKPSALYAYDAVSAPILYTTNQNASRDALDNPQNFTVPPAVIEMKVGDHFVRVGAIFEALVAFSWAT